MTRSAYIGANGQPFVSAAGAPLKRVGQSMPAPYEAGSNGRRMRGWFAPGTGPTDAAVGTSSQLRNRSRSQYRNDPYAKAGINRLVSNIVGTGIKPRSMAQSKEFQTAAQSLWTRWAPESDPEGQLGLYGQQMQAVNTWLQGGECFIRIRPRRPSDGLTVPMQLQIMESEMCPTHHNGRFGGNRIRAGIEFDPIGRRAAYWFYRSHPGEMSWQGVDSTKLTRVPADEVIHLFDPVRPGQIRGVVQMAPVLLRMYSLDKFDDATLLRQQIANLFAAFVTRKADADVVDPEDPITGQPVENPDSAIPELSLEPGLINELGDEEDIKFSAPPGVDNTYGEFLRQQLLAVAAGIEVPYEVLTGDFSKINDRTARVLLNEFRRRVQQMQQHIVVHQLCRRIWDAWLPRAILSGALDAPGYAADPGAFDAVKWIPQAWAYINPVQDVQAQKDAVRSGFKTRGSSIAETTGEDVDDVDAENAAQNEQVDSLGLVYDTDARHTDNNGKRVTDLPGNQGQAA